MGLELATLAQKIEQQQATIQKQGGDIAEIRKTLFGNGVAGWDEILRDLQEFMKEKREEAKDKEKREREERDKWRWLIITVVVTQVITAALTIWLAK